MKKYLNKKQTLICLSIVAVLIVVCILAIYVKPKNNQTHEDYARETVLFTMNDKTMPLDEAYFLTKNRQAYYEDYYYTYGTSFSWNILVEQGKTYEDMILAESFELSKQVFILSEYAKDNGITLSENEQKSIVSNVDAFLSNSDSNILKATYANEDLVTRVYTKTALYEKVREQILADKDLTIDTEDARQCLVGIVEISPEYFDSPDRIAEKIYERVNSGEVIGGVAQIYDTTVEKLNVGKDSTIIQEMIDFCLSLKDDQCKMTCIDGVYYVVYCYLEDDEVETAKMKEVLLEEKKNDYINEFVANIEKESPVTVNTDAWNTVNFDEPIYTKNDIIQSK